jgi:hypothetical protein
MRTIARTAPLLIALALVAAACGGSDDAAALPAAGSDSAGNGDLTATCLAGEPDCADVPGNTAAPLDPGDDSGSGLGMAVDGGLTVAAALETDATGTLAVQGFIVETAGEARLCDVLLESYPPQCGDASVLLDGLDQVDPESLSSEGNVRWTDTVVTIYGELVDGTLVATPLSQ